ncbi:AAA family ATPase [Streptosporangium sp. NPDC002721]|uniref:AAA family ATPase n=1 Tax=Streptosporangium sp. NPDC002721 TaxID=3366188 RepID=UPI0036BDF827
MGDRLTTEPEPIWDLEAEKAVLGACMTVPYIVGYIRAVLPEPVAFLRPGHQIIYTAILDLYDSDAPTDTIAVKNHLQRAKTLGQVGGPLYLHDLMQGALGVGDPAYHAGIVLRHYRNRVGAAEADRISVRLRTADPDDGPELLRELAERLIKTADTITVGRPQRHIVDLDEFLNAPEEEYDWLIPGLLERGDRLMLTGPEGGGKSTLWRQIAIQAASGIHPFTGETIPPLRVLYLDLENSERQSRRKLRPLRIQARDAYQSGQLTIEVRPAGLDLLTAEDNAWLDDLVAEARPDLLLTGPLYRMASGDPIEEKHARSVSQALDRIRNRGCAVLIETHCPHGTGGQKRPERPYGASLWLRWPEFGLFLADDGAVRHWRGARDERSFPTLLKRGGEWPWTAVTDKKLLQWAQIKECRMQFLEPMTMRDVEEATGIPKSTVARILSDHRVEWDALNGMSVERVG